MNRAWSVKPVRGPADEGAGGGPGEGGDAAAQASTPAAAAAAPAPKWFEDARFAPHRQWIDAKGLSGDDPVDALDKAIRGYTGAERLLGKGPERLMEKPAENTPVAEWMRANAALFGLPDAPDKYEIATPEMPKGVAWDKTLEEKARAIAHEHAVPPAALNALIGAYAERLGGVLQDAETQLQNANVEMMATLEREWGQTAPAKLAQAKAAAAELGRAAGIEGEALAALTQTLALKVGDAGVIKMFAALGGMMGEDKLANPPGGGGFGATPAEARAKIAAMDAPDGEFGRAFARGDQAELRRLTPIRQALIAIASRG